MDSARSRIALASLALAVPMLLAVPPAASQSFPAKNLVNVVPYSAGGSTDTMGRAMSLRLEKLWGRNIVIENRSGASGMIGAEYVAKSDPDGYTLLSTTSSYPATASIRKKLPFDPATAIVPVARIARAPMLLVVHPSVPAKTVKEFVALAKKQPGGLNYSSSGTGGNNHFAMALFASAAGTKLTHVPYKGVAPAGIALVSGEVDAAIASASAIITQVKAGKVRAIAVTSPKPSKLVPGLPAIAEQGVPGYSYYLWWGMFAPAGTPQNVLAAINGAVNKILATDDMQKFLATQGAEPDPMTLAELKDLLPSEIARYRKAREEAGIPLQ